MLEAPSNLKFKKFHKIKLDYNQPDRRFFCPKFGDYGLQALSNGRLTAKQLESGRLVVRRFSKKKAFFKTNVFPFLSITRKPTSARMGKGKGKPYAWVCPVRRGRIIVEISSYNTAFKGLLPKKAFTLVNRKLPIKTKFVRLIY